MTIAARGRPRLFYAEVDNAAGQRVAANYAVDTGSQVCTVSARGAKRLGLGVKPASVHLGTYGTYSEDALRVALASDLTLGNFHLRNVIFVVTADSEDGGEDGIIGLPVLLALETMRWNSDKFRWNSGVRLPFERTERDRGQSRVSGGEPIAQISIGARTENAVLDTGAYGSVLLPEFRAAFRALMKGPLEVAKREIGNGSEDPKVTTIAPLPVGVGGLGTVLQRARVLSRESVDDSHGRLAWLGMDLLGQASPVTIDFTAMRLLLRGIDDAGRTAPGTCALPPDFLCAPGWSCTVKAEDGEPCYIDRTPVEAWPGNAVAVDVGEGRHCALPQNAAWGRASLQGKVGWRGDLQGGNSARTGSGDVKFRSGGGPGRREGERRDAVRRPEEYLNYSTTGARRSGTIA